MNIPRIILKFQLSTPRLIEYTGNNMGTDRHAGSQYHLSTGRGIQIKWKLWQI